MASLTIDTDLSEKATKVFEKAGLSLKDAVDMFLRESVKKNALPFEKANENPYSIVYKKYEDKFKGAAKEAGFESEEAFNDYFFNEFRPAFYKEWKKEKGYA